jgi:conjugal transfer mating pair stabilization protein TraN
MNGLTWSTNSPSAEGDFYSGALAAEFVKQIADGARKDGFSGLFEGTPMGCRHGWLGLRDCCDVGGVAASNYDFARSAGLSVAFGAMKAGASYAVTVGSPYVYDFIGTSAAGTANAATSVASGTAAGFGAFGFGTTASSAAGLLASNSSSIMLSNNLYFNPYAFGIAVGIQVILSLMACNDEEAKLSQARGSGICHRVGTYCRKKLLGACVEHKDTFCCYNGKLGLGLQTAAKLQLGLGWGNPRAPMCGGGQSPNVHSLTIAQLSSLDFEHPSMQQAMEPFKEQIMANFNKNAKPYVDSGGFTNDAANVSGDRSRDLCLQRQRAVPSTVC